jgi:hypothetical protein
MDHPGKIIVNMNIDPPIAIEFSNAEVPGLYNLNLLNLKFHRPGA